MAIMNDIKNIDDIKLMVDTFYGKIREDEKLKDIFNNKIKDCWTLHLERCIAFGKLFCWTNILITAAHFFPMRNFRLMLERWLHLFCETVDSLFEGEKTEKAKWQGQRMAEMFHSKIDYYQNNSFTPLL